MSLEADAADNWKPSKKSIERIDGMLIMTLDCATRQAEQYYDGPGVYV